MTGSPLALRNLIQNDGTERGRVKKLGARTDSTTKDCASGRRSVLFFLYLWQLQSRAAINMSLMLNQQSLGFSEPQSDIFWYKAQAYGAKCPLHGANFSCFALRPILRFTHRVFVFYVDFASATFNFSPSPRQYSLRALRSIFRLLHEFPALNLHAICPLHSSFVRVQNLNALRTRRDSATWLPETALICGSTQNNHPWMPIPGSVRSF